MVLNPKMGFKNQVYISNYCEINPNFTLKRNSNFWSAFARNLFFLPIRCKKEVVGQVSSKSFFPRNSNQFSHVFNS
jgi:hypothetical protein